MVFTAGRKRPGISFEQIDGECGPHWLGCSVGSVDELDEQEEEEEANGPPPDAPEDAGGAVALADDAGVVDDDRRREYRRLRLQICFQFDAEENKYFEDMNYSSLQFEEAKQTYRSRIKELEAKYPDML